MSDKVNRLTKTPEQLQAALDELRDWSERHGIVIFDWTDTCFLIDRESDVEAGGSWDGYYLSKEQDGLILLSSYDDELSHGSSIASRTKSVLGPATTQDAEVDAVGLVLKGRLRKA